MWRWSNKLRWLGGLWLSWLAFSVQAERAIWMWEADSYAMVEQAATADANVAFLRAKGIRGRGRER